MHARLAPTPSGYLHRGNALNFLLNQQLAGPDGPLTLRIDDLDRSRYRPEYVEDVFRVLRLLNIEPDRGPRDATDFTQNWSQEFRLPRYQAVLDSLRDHPLLFACPCSRRELSGSEHAHDCIQIRHDFNRTDVAWRLNTRGRQVVITDLNGQRHTLDLHTCIPDVALRTRVPAQMKGVLPRPSYQLACTVDDYDMGIEVCARGVDLLPSTAVQTVLRELLGWPSLTEAIRWLHHPLLLAEGGEKLSKSAGSQSEPATVAELNVPGLRKYIQKWIS